jgi:hypothetical protein
MVQHWTLIAYAARSRWRQFTVQHSIAFRTLELQCGGDNIHMPRNRSCEGRRTRGELYMRGEMPRGTIWTLHRKGQTARAEMVDVQGFVWNWDSG